MDASKAANKAGAHEAHRAAVEALVASTLGIDAATIKTSSSWSCEKLLQRIAEH
jgi:hypothetical protein